MPFDPLNNARDAEIFNALIDNTIKKFVSLIHRHKGTLKMGDKEYQFAGLGEWAQPYIEKFAGDMEDCKSMARGYTKSVRYDAIAVALATLLADKDAKEKAFDVCKNIVDKILIPDKPKKTTDDIETAMDKAYDDFFNKVVLRILPESKDFEKNQKSLFIDMLMEHVANQKEAASIFLENSQVLSSTIYEVGRHLKENPQAPS